MLSNKQEKDYKECEEMQSLGKDKECWSCSCSVCIAQQPSIKILIQTIESICESIQRDCQEADKVLCHAGQIKFEIAKVYPKYSRE